MNIYTAEPICEYKNSTLGRKYLIYFNYKKLKFGIRWPLKWKFPTWSEYLLFGIGVFDIMIGIYLYFTL